MEVQSGVESRDRAIYADNIEISDVHEQQEQPLLSQDPVMVDLYPPTTPSRMSRFRQSLTKRHLKKVIYKWRWPILFIVSSCVMGFFMWVYRKEVFQGLETLSNKLKDMGYSGYILMSTLIFLSAFPPIIGYGTYQTLSGYTFGFEVGFPISYLSALTGAVICFSLSRIFIKARVTRMLSKYPNLEAVVRAVEKKGFKLFLLIRLSPYPFNLLNVLFAATEISLAHFAAGTAITLLKIGLHVYIGANLTSFAKHILGEDENMTEGEIRAEKVKTFAVVVGSIISFAVMAYIYRVAKAAVKEANLGDEHQVGFFTNRDEEQDIELSHGFLDDDESSSEHELEPFKTETPVQQQQQHQHQQQNTSSKLLISEPSPRNSTTSLDEWGAWGDDDEEDDDHIISKKSIKRDAFGKND